MSELKALGKETEYPTSPDKAELERIRIQNPEIKREVIRFTVPEFTSLCPVTAQPDFAIFVIDFVPDLYLVESKSLKLFMFSFRNHGAFHEDCTATIGRRLAECLLPPWIRVVGIWYARGGIPIDVVWEQGQLPEGYHPLPIDYQLYRGR